MWLQVRRRYNAVLDENRKLKEDQSVLLTSLKTRDERVKELKEKDVEVQEHKGDEVLEDSGKQPMEIIGIQQSKCIETLDKAIQTHSIGAKVSSCTMIGTIWCVSSWMSTKCDA